MPGTKNQTSPMYKKSCNTIVAQCEVEAKHTQQLCLPQISSIPQISVLKRDRYRVVLKNEILGDRLTLDEALKLAKEGES